MARQELLALHKVECLLVESGHEAVVHSSDKNKSSKNPWSKLQLTTQKQRTLVFDRISSDVGDVCRFEVLRKSKVLLDISVTFCGIQRSSRQEKLKSGRISVSEYIALMFTTVTVIIILDKDRNKANEMWDYCLQACKAQFGPVSTKCVECSSSPKYEGKIDGRQQVLLSISRNRISLCDKAEPHRCLMSWPISLVQSTIHDENLQLDISEKYTYSFKSKLTNCTEVHNHIQECIAQTFTKERKSPGYNPPATMRYTGIPNSTRVSRPPSPNSNNIYLQPIDIRPRSCKHSDEPVYTNSSFCQRCMDCYCKYYEVIDNSYLRPYNLDLNDYVRNNHDLQSLLLNGSLDGFDEGTSLITCASEVFYAAKYEKLKQDADNPADIPKSGDDFEQVTINSSASCSISEPPGACAVDMTEQAVTVTTMPLVKQLKRTSVREFPDMSDTDEIIKTLYDMLHSAPPSRDTLQLNQKDRRHLCLRLYLPSCTTAGTFMEDWQLLGEEVGLCSDAINLISATVKNHCLPYPAAEVVLRHWQCVYNKYGITDEYGKCPHACTKESLVRIMRKMKREDLVDLFESDPKVMH